jgi:hypothetical protein
MEEVKKARSASKEKLKDLASKIKLPSKTFFGDNNNSVYIIDAKEDLGTNFLEKQNKRSKSIIQSKAYDSDFNNMAKEETKSLEEEKKVQDIAGYNFTPGKEEDDEDDEEAGDGASSDF